jgi:hypothetical protein
MANTSWKNGTPEGYAFPGDPRKWEQTKYDTASKPIGKKIIGFRKNGRRIIYEIILLSSTFFSAASKWM